MTGKKKTNKPARAAVAQSEAPRFPIVGIGASAGGLGAFEGFFSGFAPGTEPGMAFVLVQHLAPDHKSILCELIRKLTHLEVFEVEEGMPVRVNCVYVIPPGRDLALLNGTLRLLESGSNRGLRLPIDFFFRSLADDHKELAIAVVLSGTGSDGSVGVRAIKEQGGLVIAQVPSSTEFEGMPRSAIATGAVDYEVTPSDMAGRLIKYTSHRGPHLVPIAPGIENTLGGIFVVLRAQTGHDFSNYKPNTVNRRIERRMAVHQITQLEGYLKYLQQTPDEVEALFRDLLIGVTNFFRDPEAFKALEAALPLVFAGKTPGSVIRVWSAGCSTGEEAYSLAILLAEYTHELKQHFILQVFATDIDSRAIATARAGVYPANAMVDVTPDRLARFFTPEPGGGFRIKKSIRDLLIFSEQDVLRDPPFSKLDLLSCRNLLIYLGPVLQRRLIPLFFYALKSEGVLFLGTSEGVGDFDTSFTAIDRKAKLYRRKADPHSARLVHARPVSLLAEVEPLPKKAPPTAKFSPRELMDQALVNHLAPPSALVTAHGDIVYLHGRTGLFLEPAPGESGLNNIIKMAREGLRTGLATTLHRAASIRESVRCDGLLVKTNGHHTLTNVIVHPVAVSRGEPLYLVLLEEAPTATAAARLPPDASHDAADARIIALKKELQAKEEYLQSTNEELESSAEELKSSNEEMQSVNEELQSTNEELETSKEELQSVNEELATVNTELQTKVIDLSRANSDMNNLLAGTGIGTVFVDRQLKILRFTPAASEITNLIASDVGRPVGHIVSNLVGYTTLVADAQRVLDTLHSHELDVQTAAGRWYTLRIQPYRTIENVIEGVVMSFTDISESVQTREALRRVNEVLRLAVVVRDAHDAITVHALDGRILAWNPAASLLYGWSEQEALLLNMRDRIPPSERAVEHARAERLRRGEQVSPYKTERCSKGGPLLKVNVVSTALLNETGEVYGIATTERAEEASPPLTPDAAKRS
ncbi:MAG: chemotaxis protein CheB [Archangium sp.]|nr:chemotaxis protein CheB [Archangium sp.]